MDLFSTFKSLDFSGGKTINATYSLQVIFHKSKIVRYYRQGEKLPHFPIGESITVNGNMNFTPTNKLIRAGYTFMYHKSNNENALINVHHTNDY